LELVQFVLRDERIKSSNIVKTFQKTDTVKKLISTIYINYYNMKKVKYLIYSFQKHKK